MDYPNRYVSSTVLPDMTPLEDGLRLLTGMEFDRIELGSTHPYEENVKEILSRYSAEYLVHNYFPAPQSNLIVNICSNDPGLRSRSLEHVKERIRFTNEIKAGLYTFHPGYISQPLATNPDNLNWDFVYDPKVNKPQIYEEAFAYLLASVKQLVEVAEECNQPVAIESSGSLTKKDFLLMQRLEEFEILFDQIDSPLLGVNVNLGHLNLSAGTFKYDRLEYIEQLSDKIFAMEVSHNEGIHDDHELLQPGEWYWKIIDDDRFSSIPIIFEGRNIPPENLAAVWAEQ